MIVRLICLVSGYLCALRVLGKKAGLVVFLGDFLKAFLPCLVVRLILKGTYPDTFLLYVMYIGLGVVLGHNFPVYLKFKGGKGIAATAGMIVGILDPLMIVILLLLFIATVAITRYVSLGSILLMIEFLILYIVFALNGRLCFNPDIQASRNCMIESIVLAVLFASLAIYKHKANIVRLIHGTENRLGQKKSEE